MESVYMENTDEDDDDGNLPDLQRRRSLELSSYLAHPPMKKSSQPPMKNSSQPPMKKSAGAQKKLQLRPQNMLNSKDLKFARKKLKRPEEIMKQVHVERAEMFDKFKKYSHMPLVDSREYLRTLRAEIVSINFTGIEQLTDAFLFSLFHCKISLDTLRWISLAGCYNISDEGVYWMAHAFKKMKTVQLLGCKKVTERSIYYLKKDNPNMMDIYMDGTSCGVVPVNMDACYMIGEKRIGPSTGKPSVYISGCPLVSPLSVTASPTLKKSIHRKVLILTPENLPWSPMAVLMNHKDQSPKQGLVFQSDWRPFKDHKMSNVNSTAEVFNVFQIPNQKGMTDLLLSPGCIVILPYHLHEKIGPCALIEYLASTITSVLTKYDDCTFALLGLSVDSDIDYSKIIEQIYGDVLQKLKTWTERLFNNIRISIQINWRMAALNHMEQEVLSAGERLGRCAKLLYSEYLKYSSTKKPMFTTVSSSIRVGQTKPVTVKSGDLQFLADIVEADQAHFPWNRETLKGEEVLQYSSGLQKSPVAVTTLTDIYNKQKIKGLSEENGHAQMSKMMSCAALWGHALYFPVMEEKVVITDFTFLADVIHKLMFEPAPRSCNLRCLGNQIPCWTFDDLMKMWRDQSKEQKLLLLRLLEKHGCLFKFAIDPWSNIKDVSFVYVLYKSFPDKPPVPIGAIYMMARIESLGPMHVVGSDNLSYTIEFAKTAVLQEQLWAEENPRKFNQADKYFFCCPGLPQSLFPNLLRQVFRLGGHALVWKQGAIIQKGFGTILIEMITEYQGLPVLVVQVRTTHKHGISNAEDQTLWTTLKLYSSIIDHLVVKYNISVAKSVPCTNCAPKSRYDILGSKDMRRFFLEHIVRVGEQRDVRCKHCDAASIALSQIGPTIQLTDLVPFHDQKGKALATVNTFNRCLMCQNCAIDGMDCDINLKQGTNNWNCGCDREGMLCDFCGMCQRCFMQLKKMVTTIQPSFTPPKAGSYEQDEMIAFDEVKVSVKGSIVGFIEKDSEFPVVNSVMTPNYCPNMAITIVKEGFFMMKLELNHPEKRTLVYESNTGRVCENDTVVLEANNANHVCHTGHTICSSLCYVQGSFTVMKLCLVLNGRVIYCTTADAQEVSVVLSNGDSEGVFLQIETQGKLQLEKKSKCGVAVENLTCSLEMRMWKLLDNMEEVCFGGRGLSLSGAACVELPSVITMDKLKYPTLDESKDQSFHHLCLSWNPLLGKAKNVSKARGKFSKTVTDSENVSRTNSDTWSMGRLIHLLDAEGIPSEDFDTSDVNAPFLFLTWHFLLASYPEMLLPDNPTKLFPPGVYTDQTQLQVKEGLRAIIRLGFWKYFSAVSLSDLDRVYSNAGRGRFLTASNKFVSYALTLQGLIHKHLSKTGLRSITSKFNSSLELFLCPSHVNTLRSKEGMATIEPELYGQYGIFLSFINISDNEIVSIPDEFFMGLPNLVDLKIQNNYICEIPGSIENCKKLSTFSITDNNLETLPEEMSSLKYLMTFYVGGNRFLSFPDVITRITSLKELGISYMMFTEIPEEIGNLVNLKCLYLPTNCLTKLPKSFEKLTQLEELDLGGVPLTKLKSSKVMSYNGFESFLKGNRMDRWLDANSKDRGDLFRQFDSNSNGVLELNELGNLNAVVFNLFPRFGYKGKEPPDESTPSGFPSEILACKKLRIIRFAYQGFTKVPPEICQLENLEELNVSHNPNLLSIPAEISKIKTIKRLECDFCPLLKTPPREIREKGFQSTLAYLQRLMSGAVLSKRTKLMMVGLGGAGKTSLVKSLLSQEGKAELKQGEEITDGIDIDTWQADYEGDRITYNVWDFAGQTVYYNTHQFFLSTNRAIYFLLWNVRLGYEHAGLDFWLSSISVQAPKAPIFVIGSHIDQVSKSELPTEEMQQRYPQIAGFHFVSSYTGQGVQELKKSLFEVTLQQQYMGEHIPAVWLTFENNIDKLKEKNHIAEYNEIEAVANRSGIFEASEIFQAVQFLHDLGSVQHFSNDYLKSKVVINPQWIVDVMACVVSVKTEVIKDGWLNYNDISTIWSDYPKNLHYWLLRLTEEFDLTFPLTDSKVNLVPCLLTEKKPKFVWPELERGSDIKENRMVYKFDYLPAGLFNRGQVRLHNFSDSAFIWKKGSFLKKNVHIALIQQTRDSELIVMAQGPRPENILFLVHEVFEALIAESFNGVTYDFSMPCPECQKMLTKDPHMFAASTIRRAIDMKAPFLQCIKYFHTISCSDLQTLLPPDNHGEFDAHLVQSVQGLKDLHKDLAADIFISYCGTDEQLDKGLYIVPSRVHEDLVNKGYKCWFKNEADIQSTDEMVKALIDSSVFLVFVSMNYAQDEECVNIFKYARLTLKKTIVVIAIGDGFEWKQSKLGIFLSDVVFINMIKQKMEFYNSKFDELTAALSGKTRMVSDTSDKPAVFFSYTWVNSALAVELGTRELPGALGYGDPRTLKSYLEDNGISCWIDVERVGMNGLFDDIAEGLLSAKVVVVCVSDQYAASSTCQMEFHYAANTLKLPIIVAVVGTGDHWRAMEVGLMSVHYPIVNFQEKTKNAKKKLLSLVEEYIGRPEDAETQKKQKNKSNDNHKNMSYMELFELAQRKLLRQLIFYAENQDLEVYPRLFVVDFMKEENKEQPTMPFADEAEREKEDLDTEKEEVKEEIKPKRTLTRHHTTTIIPQYKLERFCVYTLCEHEEGWHSVAEPILLPSDFGVSNLDTFSPYLARMTAVMKYNKKLLLKCHTDEVGQDYVKWLEESSDATLSDYQTVYHTFREMVMLADTENKMGNLMRCHLTNGKTIWICEQHRNSMRVTCLSNDDKMGHHVIDTDAKMNDYLIEGLRSVDNHVFDTPFQSLGIAMKKKGAEKTRLNKSYVRKQKKEMHDQLMERKKKGKTSKEASEETVGTETAVSDPVNDDSDKTKEPPVITAKSKAANQDEVDTASSANRKEPNSKMSHKSKHHAKGPVIAESPRASVSRHVPGVTAKEKSNVTDRPVSQESVHSELSAISGVSATSQMARRRLKGQQVFYKGGKPGKGNTSRACVLS